MSAPDALNLLISNQYLDRYELFIKYLVWFMQRGVNPLVYIPNPRCTDRDFASYITAERHMHLFGSLVTFMQAVQTSQREFKWADSQSIVLRLERLFTKCIATFGGKRENLLAICHWNVNKVNSGQILSQTFPDMQTYHEIKALDQLG